MTERAAQVMQAIGKGGPSVDLEQPQQQNQPAELARVDTKIAELSSVSHLLSIRKQVSTVIKEVMRKDVDYGLIPGTGNKPSLYKPGAEKLLSTFHLIMKEGRIEDLSAADERRYRIRVDVFHLHTGAYIGFGVGECSSSEEKYKWRKAVCQEEYDEAAADRRRNKWRKYWNKDKRQYDPPKSEQQIRTEIADISNTILKMALKRALIGATLASLPVSDFFTQDVEDMPREYFDRGGQAQGSAPASSAGKQDDGRKVSEKQIGFYGKMLKKQKISDERAASFLLSHFGVKEIADLPMSSFNAVLKWIEDGGPDVEEKKGAAPADPGPGAASPVDTDDIPF